MPRRSGAAPGPAMLSPEYFTQLRGRLDGFGCDGVEPIEASPVSRPPPPVAEDGPSPAAAEPVDVRAHVRERDGAERDLRATVRSRHAGIGDVIAWLRHVHEYAERDRLSGQPWADLVA